MLNPNTISSISINSISINIVFTIIKLHPDVKASTLYKRHHERQCAEEGVFMSVCVWAWGGGGGGGGGGVGGVIHNTTYLALTRTRPMQITMHNWMQQHKAVTACNVQTTNHANNNNYNKLRFLQRQVTDFTASWRFTINLHNYATIQAYASI